MEGWNSETVFAFLKENCPDLCDESLNLIKNAKVNGRRADRWTLSNWIDMGLVYSDVVDILGAVKDFRNGILTWKAAGAQSKYHLRDQGSYSRVPSSGSHSLPSASASFASSRELEDYLQNHPGDLAVSVRAATAASDPQHLSSKGGCVSVRELHASSQVSPRNLVGSQSNSVSKNGSCFSPTDNVFIDPSQESNQVINDTLDDENDSDSENQDPRFESIACYFSEQVFKEMGTYEKESYLRTKELYDESIKKGVKLKEPSFMQKKQTQRDEDQPGGSRTRKESRATGLSKNLSRKKTTTRKKKLLTRLSDEEMVATLPKFDIDEILKSKRKGKSSKKILEVRETLQRDGIVFGAQRKLLMRYLTNWLFYQHVKEIKDVTMDMKEGMAMSITQTYPKFIEVHPTKRPWWRILDREGPAGFIANCSVNIYRHTDPVDRPRGGGKQKRSRGTASDTDSDEEENEDEPSDEDDVARYTDKNASWMSLTMPYASNKKSLLEGMRNSYPIRKLWVSHVHPSVTEILQKYPHLMSYDGEIIVQEFELLQPGKGNLFTQNFPVLVQKICEQNTMPELEGAVPEDEHDLIQACIFIGNYLPRPNLKKYKRQKKTGETVTESVMAELKTLVTFIPLGSNIEAVVKEKRELCRSPVQPYLVALVPSLTITKLFIAADSKFIELSQTSLLFGLNMLFKVYHVFNVNYPLGWSTLWELVEHGVVGIEAHKLQSSAKELLCIHGLKF